MVALAGAVGAPARYLVDAAIQRRVTGLFPWGIFVVNLSGSALLGVVSGLALFHGLPRLPLLALGAGFCGAYTTLSTVTYETLRLGEEGAPAHGVANVVGSVLGCLLGAGAGLALAALA